MPGFSKKQGVKLKNDLIAIITESAPEHSKQARETLTYQYNSMKHFQGSNDAVIIDPRYTEMMIMLACGDFRVLFHQFSTRMALYNGWSIAGGIFNGMTPVIAKTFPSAMKPGSLRERLTEFARILVNLEEHGVADALIPAMPPT